VGCCWRPPPYVGGYKGECGRTASQGWLCFDADDVHGRDKFDIVNRNYQPADRRCRFECANGQYNASLYAAEAATERVISRMRYDFLVGGGGETVTNNLDAYRGYYPGKLGSTEDPSGYWSSFQFSDGQGHGNATYVNSISNAMWGPLDSQFAGLRAGRRCTGFSRTQSRSMADSI